MLLASRSPVLPVKRLATRLYASSFLEDFVLLYPVYALLFADTGLSTAQISSLFVIWSVTGLVLEIPSGVWADAYSRRLLLVIGPLLTAAGYALWTFAPSYPAFALGFVLWGAHGALRSGALEALVYTELDRHGAADRYAQIMGRAAAAGTVAVALAMAAAAPVFGAGGYAAVGTASVLTCLLAAAVAATLPEHRTGHDSDGSAAGHDADDPVADDPVAGYRAYGSLLRSGLAELHGRRAVRATVLLVIAVSTIWGGLEEYTPLLAIDSGVVLGQVPLFVLLVEIGVAAGGLLAGVGRRLPRTAFAGALALAAVALAVGALSPPVVGFALIAAAFCVFQMAQIVAEARLQDAITGPARSTVTSLAGFGTEVATIAFFAVYAAGSAVTGHGPLFAAWALACLPVALAAGRPVQNLRRRGFLRAGTGEG